jgi:hypothetical protein
LSCRENKRNTEQALAFEIDYENNLWALLRELQTRRYRPGRTTCFAVDKPKLREIFAAEFRDRVVHHLFVNEILEYSQRRFIFDSYACLPGKGSHKAVHRLEQFMRQASEYGRQEAYYLKLDISSFFMSIDQAILFKIFQDFINSLRRHWKWKGEMVWLGRLIIFQRVQDNYIIKGDQNLLAKVPKHKSLFGQPPGKGLPIGNFSSQYLANLYLHELDKYMKFDLKLKYYLRYVDDFVIVSQDKEELRALPVLVDEFLQEKLSLRLNARKTVLQELKKGASFLGYFVKPQNTLVKNEVLKRFKKKTQNGIIGAKGVAVTNSYFGHFRQADSHNLRRKICESLPEEKFTFTKNHTSIHLVDND